jgi:hypothetical protein
MTDAERLARAVLLFHRGGMWTEMDREEWELLTGSGEASTKTLCDLARRTAPEEEPALNARVAYLDPEEERVLRWWRMMNRDDKFKVINFGRQLGERRLSASRR